MFKTNKHRLEREYYKSRIVTFTICLTPPANATMDLIFKTLNGLLIDTLKENNCLLHIWLLMPDHCHMIIEPNDEPIDILKTIDKFKQRSGYWFFRNKINLKWQRSYYDHILRDEVDLKNQIYYILDNPVRKGIVEHWREYSYKSSMIYDLDEL